MEKPCCPRCGYDLSGSVETWRDACPVRGVCSECGLEFGWGLVMDAQRQRPAWLVEHAPGVLGAPRASLRNGWSALDGRSWWRRASMEHRVRAWRLALHWLVWLAIAHVGLGVVNSLNLLWASWFRWERSRVYYEMHGQPWQWTWAQTRELLGAMGSVMVSPWSGESQGFGQWKMVVWSPGHFATGTAVAALATVCGFLLLPVTMGRVQVKRSHLVRGLGYSASLLAVSLVVWAAGCRVMEALEEMGPSRAAYVGTLAVADRTIVLTLAIGVWWGCWWWRFAKEYLRLPRAWLIAVLLTAMGLLAAVGAVPVLEEGAERVASEARYRAWQWRNGW